MLVCDDKGLTGYGADGQVTRFDVEDEIKVPCGINLPPSGWFLRELTHFVQCAERNVPSERVRREQVLDVLGVLKRFRFNAGKRMYCKGLAAEGHIGLHAAPFL